MRLVGSGALLRSSKRNRAMFDRGSLINRDASLGMRIVRLQDSIPEARKQARKTPRKDMKDEWEKVHIAKEMLPKLEADLEMSKAERAGIRVLLHDAKAFG